MVKSYRLVVSISAIALLTAIFMLSSAYRVPEAVKKGQISVGSVTPTGETVRTVIIDPGHGGKDPGAIGTGKYQATEADIVLDIGVKLRDYINENFPDVKVIMTRDKDVFIPLKDRTEIANESEADLFISLHCNSASRSAHGSETYVLGMHKTEAQRQVAQRENKVIYLEEDYEEHYEGFDPSSPESMIALAMMQKSFLDKSISFADMVQYQFRERVKRHDRGVRQAGFWVISRTAMPSVLIELGFVTNAAEEDFLNSDLGKTYLASGIYRAFKNYKLAIEGFDDYEAYEIAWQQNQEGEKGDGSGMEKTAVMEDMPTNDSLIFKIQLMASKRSKKVKPSNFEGLEDVQEIEEDGMFKYCVGHFHNFEEAMARQRQIRESAFEDAYIIAHYNGKRISLPEAMEILKKGS